jgi:hypothetical protein
MFNQMFNDKIQISDYFCTIDCTEVVHLSPNTPISPAERNSILLKTLTTQKVIRSTNQKVGSSSPPGRATLPRSGPETWVTLRTGYMGNTLGPNGFSSGSSSRVSRSKYPS